MGTIAFVLGRIDINHPKHDYLAPHGGRRGMGEVLVRAFGYTVAARYLDNSKEVREPYSHIEAGELETSLRKLLERSIVMCRARHRCQVDA